MNEGCIPTKTLLRSAEVVHLVRSRAESFGVRGVDPSAVTFDLAAAVDRKNAIVRRIVEGIHGWVRKSDRIQYMTGRAEFVSPVEMRVDGEALTAKRSVIATGSSMVSVGVPGLAEVGFITNDEALQLRALPASMIVIGGGYVGVEFAQMYARYGTKVTLLSRSPRIMRHEEPELSGTLAQILESEGVDLHVNAPAVQVRRAGDLKTVVAEIDGEQRSFEAEEILLAAGRVPRVEGLGLEEAGVEIRPGGVTVDETLRTTARNIWSVGDVNGGPMFTHRATYDGPIAALNAVREQGKKADYRVVPRAVFTEPALASVGLTEREAESAGREVKTAVGRFKESGRAIAMGETEGLIKLVADAKTGELLGGHILGPHADILIHEVVVAMYQRGTAEAIARSIHIHPTLSEMVKQTAKRLK